MTLGVFATYKYGADDTGKLGSNFHCLPQGQVLPRLPPDTAGAEYPQHRRRLVPDKADANRSTVDGGALGLPARLQLS